VQNIGINTLQNQSIFTLYPNPSNGQIFIQVWNPNNYAIEITENTGKVVYKTNIQITDKASINTSLPSGNYYLKLTDKNGTSATSGFQILTKIGITMKKIFTLILLSIHFLSFSQNDFECGFDQARTILQNQDSNWFQNYEYHIQQLLFQKSNLEVPEPIGNGGKLNKTEPSPQARFVIPVVVQVLHRQIDSTQGMVSNISDAQNSTPIEYFE
jgi:hypothetical protein